MNLRASPFTGADHIVRGRNLDVQKTLFLILSHDVQSGCIVYSYQSTSEVGSDWYINDLYESGNIKLIIRQGFCSNSSVAQISRCGSGAGRIAAVARLRRESDTAGHTAEKMSQSPESRAVEGLPGPGGRERITPFFFHNVLDKKQQSAIINTRVLRLAVSPYWLKFYDENRHLPGWRFSLFTWSVITYPKI